MVIRWRGWILCVVLLMMMGCSDADRSERFQECDGQTVDTHINLNHCGQCGNSCEIGLGTCVGGECVCGQGFEACGEDNRCEEIRRDPGNCGGCGITCGPGEVCEEGECRCIEGLTRCDGDCVDTEVDPAHCGECGAGCGESDCGRGSCDLFCADRRPNSCAPDDRIGVACLRAGHSLSTNNHPLYCHRTRDNWCGERCEGTQICEHRGGCWDYRPARGCRDCQHCDRCTDEEECRDDLDFVEGALCVTIGEIDESYTPPDHSDVEDGDHYAIHDGDGYGDKVPGDQDSEDLDGQGDAGGGDGDEEFGGVGD